MTDAPTHGGDGRAAATEPGRSPAPVLVPTRERARPLVLHVDDDLAALIVAQAALEAEGFDVVHAGDGREAIERFDENAPDLVIMDAVMPVMDGFAAIARLRSSAAGEHVPILMITGLDDLDSITRAYDEGATDFLTKPVNPIVLPHRVQYLLRATATADALRASEAKLDNAQRIARMGHWERSLADDAVSCSRGFSRIVPVVDEDGRTSWGELLAAVPEPDREALALAASHAIETGTPFHLEFSLEDPPKTIRLEAEPYPGTSAGEGCTHLLGTIQDITERRDAQVRIHELAYFDLVTGLPNRARLHERLHLALERSERAGTRFALLFLDLDHFKQVNDTLGHDAGDALLLEVAGRINRIVRDTDSLVRVGAEADGSEIGAGMEPHTVARLGGDEFVVLLEGVPRPEDAARVAERIAASIRDPFELGENVVSVTTTIGIAVYPADGTDAETLMKHADVAMYHAKEQGRDGFHFYSRRIHERALERFSMERELRRAIENDELALEFQPKIGLGDGGVVGCEALVRWHHPERGTVSPGEFIPLAEDTGLILPLGSWVLLAACRQAGQWASAGRAARPVAVNVSAEQFKRGDMVRELADALAAAGLDPSWIEVELTESLLMQDKEVAIRHLEGIRELGVQVSIDDFGTGYSSLSYLKRLPADKLKIDRSFVRDLETDPGDAAIVSAVVTLSHDLGLKVVGEGVETPGQLERLRRFGCDEVQGFLISRPLPPDAFAAWADERRAEEGGADRRAA